MAKKKREAEPPIEFVECPECGEEQADMGKGVRCESCGYGPMPSAADHKDSAQEPSR